MKTSNFIIIKLKQLLLLAIAIAIIISIPLQFFDFLIFKRNRILKNLENRYFKISFQITDIKQIKNQINK